MLPICSVGASMWSNVTGCSEGWVFHSALTSAIDWLLNFCSFRYIWRKLQFCPGVRWVLSVNSSMIFLLALLYFFFYVNIHFFMQILENKSTRVIVSINCLSITCLMVKEETCIVFSTSWIVIDLAGFCICHSLLPSFIAFSLAISFMFVEYQKHFEV